MYEIIINLIMVWFLYKKIKKLELLINNINSSFECHQLRQLSINESQAIIDRNIFEKLKHI